MAQLQCQAERRSALMRSKHFLGFCVTAASCAYVLKIRGVAGRKFACEI